MSKIPISKNMIPYSFDISLGDEMFNIALGYNAAADLFTVALKKGDVTVCAGAPVILGQPLFEQISDGRRGFPVVKIIPWAASLDVTKVTWDNFGESVQLYIDDGETPLPPDEV